MPKRKLNRENKFHSSYVKKKWKNKHSFKYRCHTSWGDWWTPPSNAQSSKQAKRDKKLIIQRQNNSTIKQERSIIWLDIDFSIEYIDMETDDNYLDQYQDIPIWDCPICTYQNIQKLLFCAMCNHPYYRKQKKQLISDLIHQKNDKISVNKNSKKKIKKIDSKSNKLKLTPKYFRDIIANHTLLPQNKIYIQPLLVRHAMARLMRKYQENNLSVVFTKTPFARYCKVGNYGRYRNNNRRHRSYRSNKDTKSQHNKPRMENINKESVLNDAVIRFCGFQSLVYAFCMIYSSNKAHKDIINLCLMYYNPLNNDILQFNDVELSEYNNFDMYLQKRNNEINCYSINNFVDYIKQLKNGQKYIFICLLLNETIKIQNKSTKKILFQDILPIYKIQFKCNPSSIVIKEYTKYWWELYIPSRIWIYKRWLENARIHDYWYYRKHRKIDYGWCLIGFPMKIGNNQRYLQRKWSAYQKLNDISKTLYVRLKASCY